MTVDELIHHTQHVILRDTARTTLWDPCDIAQDLAEAERIFARRTHCLTDETSDMTQLQTSQGTHSYALDQRIIHVYEVLDTTTGLPLADRSRRQMPRMFGESKPRAFTTARGRNTIRLAPTPDDVYDYSMLVARLPLEKLNNNPQLFAVATPEIDEDYHLHLCQYAAYKALLNNEPEGSNTVAAAEFLAVWENNVREAKRDVFRLRTPANAHVVNNWTHSRRGC